MEINWYDVNHTYLIDNPEINWKDWYEYYTTTPEKEKEMIEWLKEYVKPFVPKSRIDKEIWMLLLNYWLKTIKDETI